MDCCGWKEAVAALKSREKDVVAREPKPPYIVDYQRELLALKEPGETEKEHE